MYTYFFNHVHFFFNHSYLFLSILHSRNVNHLVSQGSLKINKKTMKVIKVKLRQAFISSISLFQIWICFSPSRSSLQLFGDVITCLSSCFKLSLFCDILSFSHGYVCFFNYIYMHSKKLRFKFNFFYYIRMFLYSFSSFKSKHWIKYDKSSTRQKNIFKFLLFIM